MNRIIRKALSFITAAAIGSSLFVINGVSAAAASAPSVTQAVKDVNELAIGFREGAFFVSNLVENNVEVTDQWGYTRTTTTYSAAKKATITVVDGNGKATKVKNTLGFDKIYTTNTFGNLKAVENKLFEIGENCVVLGVKDKYAVLFNTGKFLENGKTFDNVTVLEGTIMTVSGKTTTVYSIEGKKILSTTEKNLGNCIDFDSKGKTALFANYVSPSESGKKSTIKMVNSKGKVVKTFTSTYFSRYRDWVSYYTTDKGKVYVRAYLNGKATYYDSTGKKVTVKEEAKTASADGSKYSVDCKYNYETGYVSKIYNKSGELLYTLNDVSEWYDNSGSKGDGYENTFAILGDRLIWVDGALHVYDLKAKKMITEKTDKTYKSMYCVKSSSIAIGEYEQVVEEYTWTDYQYDETIDEYVEVTVPETRTYNKFIGIRLINTSGKFLNNKLYSDIEHAGNSYAAADSNGKWGLVSAKGKNLTSFKYSGLYANLGTACIMSSSDDTQSVLNTSTGKVLKSKFRIAPSYGYTDYEDFNSLRSSGKKNMRVLTQNSAGTKYGFLYIKL